MQLLTISQEFLENRCPRWALSLIKRVVSRILLLRGMEIYKGSIEKDDSLDTVLIVCHESSETGAPILGLNISRGLIGKANVIIIALKGGKLIEEFKKSTIGILIPKRGPIFSKLLEKEIKKLAGRQKPAYAVINSVVSTGCLHPIRRLGVPTITLIHEFSSYIRPESAVSSIGLWSNVLIFSTELTKRDLIENYPQLGEVENLVLPQGKCELMEKNNADNEIMQKENAKNCLAFIKEDDILILGAGAIQPRKGIDIFVSVANELQKFQSLEKVKFAWIGGEYDPINDFNVSLWVDDQIRRSHLEKNVQMIDHCSNEYKRLMQRADIFLVTSRLDPLPNVAIDALSNGIPVMCFEKACGLESLFIKDKLLREFLLVPYLDSNEMGRKLSILLDDEEIRKEIGNHCKDKALEWFDMEKYISELQQIGKRIIIEQEKLNKNTRYLVGQDIIDMEYCYNGEKNKEYCAEHYLYSWRNQIGVRKPFPGFHPGIYREQNLGNNLKEDPLIHYLQSGKPTGEWISELITPNRKKEVTTPAKTALHIHIHYIDLIEEIFTAIKYNKTEPDIYITYNNRLHEKEIRKLAINYSIKCNAIILTPNKGRDIGPLITEVGPMIDNNYDVYGHIHTKKSVHIDNKVAQMWRNYLIVNLLGDIDNPMMDRIIYEMVSDESIGMVFPDDPHCPKWDANYFLAKKLAKRMGIEQLPKEFKFPVGTMFWAKRRSLSPLFNIGIGWDEYPNEPIKNDGTILHAVERLLPLIAMKQGYKNKQTYVKGVGR
jgi:glycosyltransferase involved in cell wall biosynthesis